METLHIITACSRFVALARLADNVAFNITKKDLTYKIRWHVAFQNLWQPDPHGCVKFNEMLELIPADDWIWILDDDNAVHPKFFLMLDTCLNRYAGTKTKGLVFSQNREDELGPILFAGPENMRPCGVDTAQVVFKKSLIGPIRFPEDSKLADGVFYEKLFQMQGESAFVFFSDAVTNFNGCRDLGSLSR